MRSANKKCFVTVGTTLFDGLINEVLSPKCLSELKNIGIGKIVLQIGNGTFDNSIINENFPSGAPDEGKIVESDMEIEFYRFKSSLNDDIISSDLVIGHAGAGTCLEVLKCKKLFIVVINDKLMDNHQAELANALSSSNHLLRCYPDTLSSTIKHESLFNLQPFEPISQKNVANFINKRMGLV